MNKAATNLCLWVLPQSQIPTPLNPHPEVEVLSHMVILFLNSFTFQFYFMCTGALPALSMPTMQVSGSHRGQNRKMDPLDLKLQMVVSQQVGVETQI